MEAATLSRPAAGGRTDAPDEDLVAATRAGDDRAFEALYARYQRRIGAYVLGMVKDHQRAEDVTQEVFMSALRRMRQTDRAIAFKPWVYEIAKNACIDQFRRSKRGEEVSYDAEENGVGHLVCGGPTPDVAADARQDLENLRGAFVGLNEAHHKILVMRELEGRSYAEIGKRLNMTRPAVESTLFRARKRLGEEYEELVSGERCRRVQAIIAAADEGSLGARDQRRMARHVSYCQPCRRAAALAGLGELVPARTGVRAKIAGLLPLPVVLRDRWLGIGSHHGPAAADGAGGAGALFGWMHAATPMLDASGGGWFKAMATAATVAVAGVGAGAVVSGPGATAGGLPGASALISAVGGGTGATGGEASSAAGGASSAASAVGGTTSGATGSGTRAGSANRPATGSGSASASASATGGPSSASGTTGPAADPTAGADPTADPAGAVSGLPGDPGTTPGTVTKKTDEGRQTAAKQLPTVSAPTAPTPGSAVGDTQASVPTPPDVTQAPGQTAQQAAGTVADAGQALPGIAPSVGNALPTGG